MANDKVILLQDASGQVKQASVNGAIFSVMNAGPVMIPGKAGLGASLTISPETADVTIKLAPAPQK
ncbi:hypothetical protein SAMN05519104_6659 [Rhizobiales bacterium GAS188]|nr:hypothetical protein SAMN05519104_6659 [Rhizobiales bacterium GAS188]